MNLRGPAWIGATVASLILLLPEGGTRPWSPGELQAIASMSPAPPPPPSPSNRFADDPLAARLGGRLFSDTRLSGDGSTSCASCHDPSRAFTDGRTTAVGLGEGRRNTPTILGAAHLAFLTWDGRKDSLWSQALAPIESPTELGSHRLLVARLMREAYANEYAQVFGSPPPPLDDSPPADRPIEEQWQALAPGRREAATTVFVNVGKALEAYERTLVAESSPFDRYAAAIARGDSTGGGHLSSAARRGLAAFLGPAGCVHCHSGPLLSDGAFHRLGLPEPVGAPDPGRRRGLEELLSDPFRSDGPHADGVTLDLVYLNRDPRGSEGAFKTPTLRHVAATAPYGHAGQFATLETMLAHYRSHAGPRAEEHGLDPILATLDPEFDSADMIAFLRSLGSAE